MVELTADLRKVLRKGDGKIAETAEELVATGRPDLARVLLERAVENAGVHPGLLHNLGLVLFEDGDFAAALRTFDRAIAGSYPSHVSRGLVFETLGDLESARRDYDTALELDADEIEALVNLGLMDLAADDTAGALALLKRAARLDPTAHWQLGDAYVAADDPTAALDSYSKAIEHGEVRAYLDRADLNAVVGNDADAIRDYEAAIAFDVKWSRREYAVYLDLHDDQDSALEVARRGVEEGDELCFAPLAVILESRGELREALHYYELAVEAGNLGYIDDIAQLKEELSSSH